MKVDQEVRSKVIALQSDIMEAQTAALTGLAERADLQERVRFLEGELRKQQSWEQETARYRLQEFPSGRKVYALIPERANGEPIHNLCPACFQKHVKSILQPITARGDGEIVDCPDCKLRLTLVEPPPVRADHGNYY
jgi:hypothetical protein